MQKKKKKEKINKKLILILLSWSFLLLLDLLTKYYFYNKECCWWLSFVGRILNDWVSWWMQLPYWVIICVSLFAILAFVWMFKKWYFGTTVFVLLLAGTLGNFIDRISLGWVRDFIVIWSFPVFNIADVLLNIGIWLFILKEIITYVKWKNKK